MGALDAMLWPPQAPHRRPGGVDSTFVEMRATDYRRRNTDPKDDQAKLDGVIVATRSLHACQRVRQGNLNVYCEAARKPSMRRVMARVATETR
jgi:hypothetical protein